MANFGSVLLAINNHHEYKKPQTIILLHHCVVGKQIPLKMLSWRLRTSVTQDAMRPILHSLAAGTKQIYPSYEFTFNESMGLDGSLNLNEKVNARAQPCQKQ